MSRVSAETRRASVRRPLAAVLLVLLALPFGAGSLLPGLSSAPDVEPLMCVVVQEPFVHEVMARGEVESAINVEVRCEARPRDSSWLRILEVIPEGTRVKPGDFLIRLDSRGLENELEQQKIRIEQTRAAVAAAKGRYEIAQKAKVAYLEGEYQLDRKKIEAVVAVAVQREHQARKYLESSRKLEALGCITQQQLQADEFALSAAETDLRLARLRLTILDDFTRPKRLLDLETMLATTKARLASVEYWHSMNEKWAADIQEQIAKCVICAPVEGEVVLAHMIQNDHSHLVEPGEQTHTHRTLVRLPDPRHMQVNAKIEEDRIACMRKGLPVTVSFEAFPGLEVPGEVVRVNEYPEAEDWHGSGVKQYRTTVRIDASVEGLRPA